MKEGGPAVAILTQCPCSSAVPAFQQLIWNTLGKTCEIHIPKDEVWHSG